MPANLLSYLCCTPEGAHAGFADVDTATALSLPSPDLGAPPLRLFLLTHVEDAAVCSTLNKEWATQWRQEMNTNLASLSDLNRSQRDGVAKAVMQTCSLWQVSLHFKSCALASNILASSSVPIEWGQPVPAPRHVMPACRCRLLTPAAAASKPYSHLHVAVKCLDALS